MSINLTDELLAKTKKGKIASAKQVFLEGDQENLQQIGDKTNQLEDAIKDITVTGGASTANAVSYNNDTSGMTSVTAQGAIDELAAKNATKAEKAEVTAELEKKFDKESILQESGDAEDKVMSQKATTSAIADETTRAKAAEEAIIFDVSVNNNGAVFESLQAILSSSNLNTLIPASVRHGGMSIRFIQGSMTNSDNKYVQYRYLETAISGSPNPFLDASNWLGVNEEYIAIKNTVLGIDGNTIAGYKLDVNNTLIKADGWGVSDYIDVPKGNFQVYFGNGASTNYLVFVDDNEVIKGTVLLNNNTGGQAVTISPGATKFRFTFSLDYDNVRCAYLSNVFYSPVLSKESIDNRVLSIESLINDGFVFAGIANLNTQPISPTKKVFYIATLKGTYTNFNNIVVNTNDVVIIKSNGSTWVKQVLGIKPKSKFYYDENIHIFNELYISPSVTWTDLYIRVTSITGGWRVILGDSSDFSGNYKAVDITDANLGLIQNVNNIIFFSLDSEKLYNTSIKRGNIDVTRNPINSPCCYASYLNLNTKNDLTTLINNRVTPIDNRVTTLENTINGQVGNYTINKYLGTNGTEIDAIGFAISDYIDVPAGNFQVYYSNETMNGKYLIFYDDDGNKVGNSVNLNNQAGSQSVTVQEGATKFRFSFDMNYNNVRSLYLSIPIYTPIYPINGLQGTINDLQEENEELSQNIDIIQNGKAGNCHIGYYLNTYGNEVVDSNFAVSDYVNVTGDTRIQVYYSNQSEIGKFLIGYDSNNEKVQVQQLNTGGGVAVDLLSTVTKIRFSFRITYTDARVVANKVVIYTPVIPVLSILDASKEYVDNKIISSNDSLMFTLIDDDFTNTTSCTALVELCESLGIHCSFALIPDYADDRVTPSIPISKLNIVKDFEERGFSFAMHPNHSLFYGAGEGTVGTLAEREKCLVKTQRLFDQEGILYGSKILVWPGSSDTINSEEAIPIAQRNVEIAIHAGAYGGVFVNTKDKFASMRYKMVRLSLDFNKTQTKTKIKSDIDSAVSNGKGLVIFICHTHMHWVDQTTVDETTKSWPNLVEVLTYAASKGVPFVSMKEAYMRKIEPEYMPTLILKNI